MVLRAETGHPACPLRGRPCPFTRKSVTYLLQSGLDSIRYKVILHSTTMENTMNLTQMDTPKLLWLVQNCEKMLTKLVFREDWCEIYDTLEEYRHELRRRGAF